MRPINPPTRIAITKTSGNGTPATATLPATVAHKPDRSPDRNVDVAAQNNESHSDGSNGYVAALLKDIDEVLRAEKTRVYQGYADDHENAAIASAASCRSKRAPTCATRGRSGA